MKRRQILVGAIAVVVLAAGGWFGYGYFESTRAVVGLPLVRGCALHRERCSAQLPSGGRMSFAIEPRNPSPTDPLVMQADFEQVKPHAVSVRFKGVDMNMGYLEHFAYPMQKTESAHGVSFSGNGGVFACSSDRMVWHVLVKLQLDDTTYEVPFEFVTLNKPGEA